MSQRLPLAVAVTALVVAVLGSTPLGEAAGDLADAIVPRAKRADYALNAGAVNGIKASRTPRPGFLVPLGADGKLPASAVVGAAAAGKGFKEYEFVQQSSVNDSSQWKGLNLTCPSGKKLLGAGARIAGSGGGVAITSAGPSVSDIDKTANFVAQEINAQASSWTLQATIYCARVS
jgi:hypothetical protein